MLSLLTAALLGATFRVETNVGVPQITVDSQPVRARMFWGGVVPTPLPIGPQGQMVQFEFVGQDNAAAAGTIHFRFGQSPGDVWLDDVTITDLDAHRDVLPRCTFEAGPGSFARQWTFWPPGPANTVGTVSVEPGVGRDGSAGLHVRLKTPPDGRWPDFHIYHHPRLTIEKGKHYRVSLWARADSPRGLTVGLYRPGPTFVSLGGPNPPFSSRAFASQIRLAAGAGVNFVSFPVHLPWPEPGQPTDWTTSDGQCQAVLDANPQAWLLPRIGVDPPAWWRQAHPDEMMHWEDGLHGLAETAAAPASQLYRREAAAQLSALIAHLEAKFGPHLAGYHPCGQNTGEWFYYDTWREPLSGYAPVELAAWRKWLSRRYVEDAALRRAWIAGPAAPAPRVSSPRDKVAHLRFLRHRRRRGRRPRRAAPARLDSRRRHLCHRPLAAAGRPPRGPQRRVARPAHRAGPAGLQRVPAGDDGRLRVRPGPGRAPRHRRTQAGGVLLRLHVRVWGQSQRTGRGRALCPAAGAGLARHRRALLAHLLFRSGPGRRRPSMTAAESVALAGKLWLNEDDTSTYLSSGTQPGHKTHDNLEETNALLVRNVAQESLRNFGTWWMDLGSTGWFDDPGMWAEMARLRALDEPLLKHPGPTGPRWPW